MRVSPLVLGLVLTACAPSPSSAHWAITAPDGAFEVEAVPRIVDVGTSTRLAIEFVTQGEPGIADDEAYAVIFIDLTDLPIVTDGARSLAIRGTAGYVHRGLSGFAGPPDEAAWTYTPDEGNDPAVQRVLVYWGAYSPAIPSYATPMSGTLVLEESDPGHVLGSLHLDLGAPVPVLFHTDAGTMDVTFDIAR